MKKSVEWWWVNRRLNRSYPDIDCNCRTDRSCSVSARRETSMSEQWKNDFIFISDWRDMFRKPMQARNINVDLTISRSDREIENGRGRKKAYRKAPFCLLSDDDDRLLMSRCRSHWYFFKLSLSLSPLSCHIRLCRIRRIFLRRHFNRRLLASHVRFPSPSPLSRSCSRSYSMQIIWWQIDSSSGPN